MSPKRSLILMTAIAVISDSLLHPFYPQYLARVFGVVDARQVGLYIAASSLTVLVSLPGWALVSRRVPVFRLLIATQAIAAGLSFGCAVTRSWPLFYLLSLVLLMFKASYLLIYPYLMSLEDDADQLGTIGLLAFVVYFANMAAALLSGVMLELLDPRQLFVAMAAGDMLQIVMCVVLLRRSQGTAEETPTQLEPPATAFVYKLGTVTLVMYFSAYLSEPFFASYWESIAPRGNTIVSGCVFAIPALSALLGLYVNARRHDRAEAYPRILFLIALTLGGLWLQASARPVALVFGRFVYGWSIFQLMVRLDALLFRLSSKHRYAADFSKLNLFQGVGVMLASLSAGTLVSWFGPKLTFGAAAAGFSLGACLYCGLFRHALWPRANAVQHEEIVT